MSEIIGDTNNQLFINEHILLVWSLLIMDKLKTVLEQPNSPHEVLLLEKHSSLALEPLDLLPQKSVLNLDGFWMGLLLVLFGLYIANLLRSNIIPG